jgi:hypothetical protein
MTERKTFLYVISTQYEGKLVGRILKWRNEWEALQVKSGFELPKYGVTLAWKSLWKVKPGEQDIILAGGREDDEEQVLKMKGSGQIIIRYSQLGLDKPYSGRSEEELGYSFLAEKRRADLDKLIYSKQFVEGLAQRNPEMMLDGLHYGGIYPTGYLEECCRIQVPKTPENLIQEAIANEAEAISESQREYYRPSRSSVGMYPFF